MIKRKNNFKNNFGININNFKFLGKGSEGKVFLMPNNKVIKIFKSQKSCREEFLLLKSIEDSKNFPKVYKLENYYMIRDYVGGTCIKKYIKKHGLNKNLCVNLINLIKEFQRLGFTRLDIRLNHIFVQKDESLIIIDPRKTYHKNINFPKHMIKGLRELRVLNKFWRILKKESPNLYKKWRRRNKHK